MPRFGIAFAGFVSLAAETSLAQQYGTERHRLLPPDYAGQSVAGDFDGDGDPDLIGYEYQSNSLVLLTNDGNGRFATSGTVLTSPTSTVMAAGDIDGDGDLDLVIGGAAFFGVWIPGRLLRNNGAGVFTNLSSQWLTAHEATTQILLRDYDNDGDLDILTGSWNLGQAAPGYVQPINRLYLNNGAGTFTDVTASRLPALTIGAFAADDVDGDGDLDLVLPGTASLTTPATVRVLLQNALGVAIEVPGAIPATPVVAGSFTDVVLRDFDLDGDLDLAAASTQGLQFFTNGGGASFTLAGTLADASVVRWLPADFNGDGRVDLLALRASVLYWPTPWLVQYRLPARLYSNTASGFVDVTATHLEGAALVHSLVLAVDIDGDADIDVYAATRPQATLWHNDGQGHLLQVATHELTDANIVVAAAGDADGDGDLDVAAIEEGFNGRRVIFVPNLDGLPGVEQSEMSPWNALPARSLAWIDADHDGDLDLFVGTAGNDRLFHNVNGTFVDVTAAQLPASIVSLTCLVADVDGDGNPDLLLAGFHGSFFRGNGTGGFVDATSAFPGLPPYASGVAALDIDGDGDLDVVHSLAGAYTTSGGIRVLRNDWPAPFVDITASLALPVMDAWCVATLDIDQDGRRDLLVGDTSNGANWYMLRLLRTTSTGLVDETAARVPQQFTAVGDLTIADIDGDGRDDVVCRDQQGNRVGELRNNQGVLVPLPLPLQTGWSLPFRPAVADFDRDGDPDLVTSLGVTRNRTRDLANALPPRLGRPAALVAHAWAGNGMSPQGVILMFAPQLAPSPIAISPFGRLFLDPATLFAPAAAILPSNGGEATFPYSIAASPALINATIFAQGLFLHEPLPSSWRLGNLVTLRVRL